jgi:hypothetical protein
MALDCATSLQDGFKSLTGNQGHEWVLDLGLHAGSVIVERRSANPLFGWQITTTFGLCRLLVNLNRGKGLALVTARVKRLGDVRYVFEKRSLIGDTPSELAEFYALRSAQVGVKEEQPKFSRYTRYQGRDLMLASLLDRLREAGEGKPSVALLLGDEGMGKSRLREEFRQSCRKLGASFFLGSGARDERHFAYATFLAALRKICGINPPETAEQERQKLSRLRQLGLSREDLELIHSLYDEQEVTFAKAMDSSRKGSIFAVFDKLLEGLGKDAPLVLAFEEFQFADGLTEEFIAHLVSHLTNRKLVLLLEVPADYSRPWLAHAPLTTYSFESLAMPVVEGMIQDMLGVLEVSSELLNAVFSHTGGNPLFVKELVGLMVDEGGIEISIMWPALLRRPMNPCFLPRLTC